MKKLNKIFLSLGVAAAALGTASCTGDLDLLPVDPNQTTAGTFQEDPEGYMKRVLADVYLNFSTFGPNGSSTVTQFDGGMSTFSRGLFILEEIPTDEANWLSTNDTEYGVLQYGPIPANSPIAGGVYSRLTINITLCNDFIRTVNEGLFSLPDNLTDKAAEYVRQAKILRSACYYYLVDLYGNVPYADETTSVGAVTQQLTRAQVFNLVTTTLEDVVKEYGNNNSVVYGFVGKEVAQALLVKFYLNAEVYTGTPMWDKCYAVANDIIRAHQGKGFNNSGLAEHYHNLFGRNSKLYAKGGGGEVEEILWHIVVDQPNLLSYAGGALLTCGYLGSATTEGATCDLTRWNMSTGWRCMTARQQFSEVFDWNEDYTYSPDIRTKLWCTAADGFAITNDVLSYDFYGSNGFAPVKYSNWNYLPDGEIDYSDVPVAGGDDVRISFAMIRLAEIYLSAAEAALHGAASKADVLPYVNYIRERAGLSPWSEADLNLVSLRDERQRELYSEITRRTDLIRYGTWCSGYTWNWKGGVKNGTDLPDYSVLYPLPAAIVQQTGYQQNYGY